MFAHRTLMSHVINICFICEFGALTLSHWERDLKHFLILDFSIYASIYDYYNFGDLDQDVAAAAAGAPRLLLLLDVWLLAPTKLYENLGLAEDVLKYWAKFSKL